MPDPLGSQWVLRKEEEEEEEEEKALMGARLGSQWVLSGFSVGLQRILSEYSGFSVGSQTVHF